MRQPKGLRTAPSVLAGRHRPDPVAFNVKDLQAEMLVYVLRNSDWTGRHADEQAIERAVADVLRVMGIMPVDDDGKVYDDAGTA